MLHREVTAFARRNKGDSHGSFGHSFDSVTLLLAGLQRRRFRWTDSHLLRATPRGVGTKGVLSDATVFEGLLLDLQKEL